MRWVRGTEMWQRIKTHTLGWATHNWEDNYKLSFSPGNEWSWFPHWALQSRCLAPERRIFHMFCFEGQWNLFGDEWESVEKRETPFLKSAYRMSHTPALREEAVTWKKPQSDSTWWSWRASWGQDITGAHAGNLDTAGSNFWGKLVPTMCILMLAGSILESSIYLSARAWLHPSAFLHQYWYASDQALSGDAVSPTRRPDAFVPSVFTTSLGNSLVHHKGSEQSCAY